MKQLVFATQNSNKINEVKAILPANFNLVSLKDLNWQEPLAETGNTFQANALQKIQFIYDKFGMDGFAEDSGLEIIALQRAPGVNSARYAGNTKNDYDNLNLVLKKMNTIKDRSAQFKTVIALIFESKTYFFEGIINGTITHKPIGINGFGYDSIFVPENETRTFAQMKFEEKNKISHRKIAFNKLQKFLRSVS